MFWVQFATTIRFYYINEGILLFLGNFFHFFRNLQRYIWSQ